MAEKGSVSAPAAGEQVSSQGGRMDSSSRYRQTNRVMWVAVVLAMISALAYVLIALDILGVGDLRLQEAPPAIAYVAAGGYLLGGLLILVRPRWLWSVGAVINALVILFFFLGYQDRPAVIFSPGGLVTKAAEVLLEACLIYLIVTYRPRSRHQPDRANV